MNKLIRCGIRSGEIRIPSSKSELHRLLICAAFGSGPVNIGFDGLSRDIEATAGCLRAMGAGVKLEEASGASVMNVVPIRRLPSGILNLECGESGSTLRFLMPVLGALGAEGVFARRGRLSERPIYPFDDILRAHGMKISEFGELLYCGGRLESGAYELPGNVSSQYISGLLMSLPFIQGDSSLKINGDLESSAYVGMTEYVLKLSGVKFEKKDNRYSIPGGQQTDLPTEVSAEGDYSNAAFFLCMGALSEDGVRVRGLRRDSPQGDRAVLDILKRFGAAVEGSEDGSVLVRRGTLCGTEIDASQTPDLIPALAALAAAAEGDTRVINAARLRMKESDRLESTAGIIRALGGDITVLEDRLIIPGGQRLKGGTVDPAGDHRIAMAAAVAACCCSGDVEVAGSECVSKSYPRFWEDLESLKGGR